MSTTPLPGAVRRVLVSHALAALGMSLPWPLLVVMVWDRVGDTAHGDLAVGLTGAARMLPYVLLSWATGMLADRFRRDRLLRLTLAARVVLLGAVGVALTQDWLLAAVVAAALAVACGTPAYPALAAAMPAVAGPARRRATDLLVTIEVASFVAGPALGGLLLAPATRPWISACAVASTVVAGALVIRVRLPRSTREETTERSATPGPVGVLRASPVATRAVGTAGLLNGVAATLALALLPLAELSWSGGASGFGPATGMLGFGALAAPVLWRLGSSATTRARWGLLLLAGALAVVPLTPDVWWAVLPLVAAGAATVHVEGAVTEAIQDAVPDCQRAGILGLTDSVMVAAALLGSLLAPWLAATLGARGLIGLLAVVCLATLLLTVGTRRATAARRIPRQRTPVGTASVGVDDLVGTLDRRA